LKYIDTHCHLSLNHFDNDRKEVIEETVKNLSLFIEIGINVENSEKVINLVKDLENGYCSVGIHPTDTEGFIYEEGERIKKLSENKKVIGIGEIGLDFHWDTNKKDQYKAFDMLLNVAKENKKPVIFHVREAYSQAYDFLIKNGIPERGGVLHCYSGNWEEAKKFLDLGLYLGFDGPVTYPKNDNLVEIIEKIPLERILLETDSPFLPPVPYRGKRNQPKYVEFVYNKVAEIKEISVEELSENINKNVNDLFFK